MSRQGYILLHRSLQDSELWEGETFNKSQAWIDLIFLANFKESTFFKRGVEVKVPRGSLAWGEVALSKRWRWSRQKTRSYLYYLETRQQITQHKSNVITVIEIINYEKYQANQTTDQTTERQQIRQQKDTYNKSKIKKTMLNKKDNTYAFQNEFNYLWNMYPVKRGRKEAFKSFKSTVKTKEDVYAIKLALDNYMYELKVLKTDTKYIKHGSTWFNNWEDYKERIKHERKIAGISESELSRFIND